MATIDIEITRLHERIAELEKEKSIPPPKIIPTPQKLLKERLKTDKIDNRRPDESPIATACRFSRQSENVMLESIVEALNKINARLDALEKK
jgi:hypothetical protein